MAVASRFDKFGSPVVIPQHWEKRVTLELSEDEADALAIVLGSVTVGGKGRHAQGVYRALAAVGFFSDVTQHTSSTFTFIEKPKSVVGAVTASSAAPFAAPFAASSAAAQAASSAAAQAAQAAPPSFNRCECHFCRSRRRGEI